MRSGASNGSAPFLFLSQPPSRLMEFKVRRSGLCHPFGLALFGAGGGFVAYYRLYLLSAPEGRFVGFEEIEAADDVEAVARAEDFVGSRPLELWCGSRRVHSFPAVADVEANRAAARSGH